MSTRTAEFPGAVTACSPDGSITEMDDKAARIFEIPHAMLHVVRGA